MNRLWFALALSVFLAPAAFAGGLHARIEAGADGVSYIARTYGLHEDDVLEPWAYAEGLVGGKRVSVLIRVEPTSERGVYRFARTWPTEGRWMIRYLLGHPPAPMTVTSLNADGSVRNYKLYRRTSGSVECHKALTKGVKLEPGEGC